MPYRLVARKPASTIGYHFTPIIIKPRASEKRRILEGCSSVLERQIEREGAIFIIVLEQVFQRERGNRKTRMKQKREKNNAGSLEKRGESGDSSSLQPVYPSNKYIIMPVVPLACFQPHPRCLPCTGRFFSPPRKNRPRKKRARFSLLSPGLTDKI